MQPAFEPHKLLHTLPVQIADQIAESIVDGRFPPNSRLRETELATSFDVSRATIRESLRLLEQRSLVKILPQRGAYVTQLSAKELDDLFEVRASLLATGSRLAANQCSDANAKVLQDFIAQLHANLNDLAAYALISAELVNFLMKMSGNVVLADYIRDFAQRIGCYVRLGLSSPERRAISLDTWREIVAAIIRGDGKSADANHRKLALENRSAALAEVQLQSEAIIS